MRFIGSYIVDRGKRESLRMYERKKRFKVIPEERDMNVILRFETYLIL